MVKIRRGITFLLLIGVVLSTIVHLLPISASYVTAISFDNQYNNSSAYYLFDQDESKQFVDSLQKVSMDELPIEQEVDYKMTLHLKNLFSRTFDAYLTKDRQLYLARPIVKEFYRIENTDLFHNHEPLKALLLYGIMPEIYFFNGDNFFRPKTQEQVWQYDIEGNNYDGKLQPFTEELEVGTILNSEDDSITFSVEIKPDRIHLQIVDSSGESVFDQVLASEKLPIVKGNGHYDYHLSLYWEDEDQPYNGQFAASFPVEVNLPATMEVSNLITMQGDLITVYINNLPHGVTPELKQNIANKVNFYSYLDGYVAYIPTNYYTEPGLYPLSWYNGENYLETTLTILPRDFLVQHLQISTSIERATRNEEAYKQYHRYFPPSRANSSEERYYDEPFVIPVAGRLTTEFGETRYVNNARTSSYHSGLDIAAPAGTPILATNRGRVTLAMELIIAGNTLVIDHGQGLFSVYFHMEEIFVEEGELVEGGQLVATVGSTGFSTGPHLHFTMSYYQQNLEPGYFLVGEPITKENYTLYLKG